MSIWIRSFLASPLGPLDPAVFQAGIEERLGLLTYLFCPEDEEEPEVVIDRLRVEAVDQDNVRIFYRSEPERFLPVERWSGDRAAEEVQEELERLSDYPSADADKVRELVRNAVETVAFELKLSDAQGMGWPTAIAAAAKIVEIAGGVVSADDSGWMVPAGKEVSFLLDA